MKLYKQRCSSGWILFNTSHLYVSVIKDRASKTDDRQQRSVTASNILIDAGYTDVYNMLVGKILSSITAIRILAPYYVGIFGPRLGIKIMLFSSLLREGVLIVITLLIVLFC